MILDLESWNNSDNVFLGATPADQDDGAGAEADGEVHAGHQPQALQAREHDGIFDVNLRAIPFHLLI